MLVPSRVVAPSDNIPAHKAWTLCAKKNQRQEANVTAFAANARATRLPVIGAMA